MPDLATTRATLAAARAEEAAARDALFAATQRRAQLDYEIEQLRRVTDERSRNTPLEAANARKVEADARVQRDARTVASLRTRVESLEAEFAALTDPRTAIGALGDDTPILLFPVRLETRFKTIQSGGANRQQLWVRVYPDDCVMDAFEATLSEKEVASGRFFWSDWWAAGGDDAKRRAAWRDLVASHGIGRATWLAQQLKPTNAADEPIRAGDRHIILAAAATSALSAGETTPVATYWESVWRAGDDAAKKQEARRKLIDALGEDGALVIERDLAPRGLAASPPAGLTREDPAIRVDFVVAILPTISDTKQRGWSQAPRVRVMPDRFAFLGYQDGAVVEQLGGLIRFPLVCGPDPSAPAAEQLRPVNGELSVPDDMKWIVDFDEAIAAGLGFKIDLTDAQARAGFDRIVVLGVRLAEDAQQGQASLTELIQHLQHSGRGLSLLRQGTPTNNTEGVSAGYARGDDPDAAFDDLFIHGTLFADDSDPFAKKDGQWLAECLGIESDIVRQTHNAGGRDQIEARAMNTALWPATLGYFMESMMHPLFDDTVIAATQSFYTRFVSGRGAIPALRINRQPYGILPTTAFTRMRWRTQRPIAVAAFNTPPTRNFSEALHDVLMRMRADWMSFAADVSRLGVSPPGGDAHQQLLDVIALHPSSVEHFQRYAEGLDHLYNVSNLDGAGALFLTDIDGADYSGPGRRLLARLGYENDMVPAVLNCFFLDEQNRLQGPLVDDRPLSEVDPIRAYTPAGLGYIAWLAQAARTSLEDVRRELGFRDDTPPAALLYLFLRHAVMLEYWRTSLGLHETAGVLTTDDVRSLKREAPFIHVKQGGGPSESRWRTLYAEEPAITGAPGATVAEHIVTQLGAGAQTAGIDQVIAALEKLKDASTASLERAFTEHVDCCSYRLDAWILGLAHERLTEMRAPTAGVTTPRKGIHLGAYGWLEDVRSESKTLTPVQVPAPLDTIFNTPGAPPLMRDDTNGGYIVAPSSNQAVTAAVLRNGYLANATPQAPGAFAVNLTSARVRSALAILDGITAGQSLGALLGYQFERWLHDRAGITGVDGFVSELRREFPLRANKVASTLEEDRGVPIEALEARNVIDGEGLLEHVRSTGNANYPFGLPLPAATSNQRDEINRAVVGLADLRDAVADVLMTEGVFQAVQGNYERASGTLDTLSKGGSPPEPEVIRTPRSGRLLTHRVGLQLDTNAATTSSFTGIGMTPRAKAAPELNAWLAGILPDPATVGCMCSYYDVSNARSVDVPVTQVDLGLQPIDLLYVAHIEGDQAMGDLDDRIVAFIAARYHPRPDAPIAIRYREGGGAVAVTFFELSALVRHLRALLLTSRPLRATDVTRANEADRSHDEAVSLDRDRAAGAESTLDTLRGGIAAYRQNVQTLLNGLPGTRTQIASQIDTLASGAAALLESAGQFGLPQAGRGFVAAWVQSQFTSLLTAVDALVQRWEKRLTRHDERMAEYAALLLVTGASESEKLAPLRRAEYEISTTVVTPNQASTAVATAMATKRAGFVQQLDAFRAILTFDTPSVSALRAQIDAELPIDAFDTESFDMETSENAIVAFARDLAARLRELDVLVAERLGVVRGALAAHDATASSRAKVERLEAALHAMFGDEFKVVPRFTISDVQGAEWALAESASRSGALLRHAVTLHDFPVDDWMYGVARVRDKLRDWEAVVMLGGALSSSEPPLMPIQLPHKPDDYWLGLEAPSTYEIDSDRLLYTAHYAKQFDKTAPQCGLLLDEWTEVIPSDKETIGVTFHFDRPNCEAPQTMLLVVPPELTGAWRWNDVVDAIHETFDLARIRSVGPMQIDQTPYAAFLPATVMAATKRDITIGTLLAINNGLYTAAAKQ